MLVFSSSSVCVSHFTLRSLVCLDLVVSVVQGDAGLISFFCMWTSSLPSTMVFGDAVFSPVSDFGIFFEYWMDVH